MYEHMAAHGRPDDPTAVLVPRYSSTKFSTVRTVMATTVEPASDTLPVYAKSTTAFKASHRTSSITT
jgi:hypothetical protein